MYNLVEKSNQNNSFKKSLEVVNRIGIIENITNRSNKSFESNIEKKLVEVSLISSESERKSFEFILFKDQWTAITGKRNWEDYIYGCNYWDSISTII